MRMPVALNVSVQCCLLDGVDGHKFCHVNVRDCFGKLKKDPLILEMLVGISSLYF